MEENAYICVLFTFHLDGKHYCFMETNFAPYTKEITAVHVDTTNVMSAIILT